MTPIRKAAASAAILLFAFFCAGCGDTFRPIALPIVQSGGDPQPSGNAIILSNNGASNIGATTHINVSGDSNVGQVSVGVNPIYATVLPGNTRVVVANAGESTLSLYAPFNPTAGPANTITLPAGSTPRYVFSNGGTALFVALSARNSVGIVDLGLSIFSGEIPVGTNPAAMVGTPDGTKLYVANQGDGTVSVISRATKIVSSTVTVGSSPVAMVVSADGKKLYVVNQGSNSVSVIDTGTDTATALAVGTSPNFAVFDPRLLRVYVTNSGSNTVSIINADPNAGAAFNTAIATVPVGTTPKSVAALADGTRAYVANSGSGTVSVINTLNNAVIRTIIVGTTPVSLVASPDSTKVTVANQGSNNASVIRTSDDTVVATIDAPLADPTCNPAVAVSKCARMTPILAIITQ